MSASPWVPSARCHQMPASPRVDWRHAAVHRPTFRQAVVAAKGQPPRASFSPARRSTPATLPIVDAHGDELAIGEILGWRAGQAARSRARRRRRGRRSPVAATHRWMSRPGHIRQRAAVGHHGVDGARACRAARRTPSTTAIGSPTPLVVRSRWTANSTPPRPKISGRLAGSDRRSRVRRASYARGSAATASRRGRSHDVIPRVPSVNRMVSLPGSS